MDTHSPSPPPIDGDTIAALIPASQTLLFWIQRSLNRNVVVYVATEDGSVDAYWLMFEKATTGAEGTMSVPTEPLTATERRMAYGFTLDPAGTLSLSALPSRTFRVVGPPPHVSLGDSEIVGLFVQMKGGLIPRVHYVDVHFADGRVTREAK